MILEGSIHSLPNSCLEQKNGVAEAMPLNKTKFCFYKDPLQIPVFLNVSPSKRQKNILNFMTEPSTGFS